MIEKHPGLQWLADMDQSEVMKEDFDAEKGGKYTVKGIDPNDDNWLKKASKKVNAAKGDDYVQLDSGLLTVNQINWMLRNSIGEMTFCDDNHQLKWYNRNPDPNYKMLSKRRPNQLGHTMNDVHPHVGNVIRYAKQVWYGLRNKFRGHDEIWTPVAKYHGAPIQHYQCYKRVEDDEGNFRGILEYSVDLKPIVDYYLKTNGLKAVKDPNPQRPDHVASPGDLKLDEKEENMTDATTGTSQH